MHTLTGLILGGWLMLGLSAPAFAREASCDPAPVIRLLRSAAPEPVNFPAQDWQDLAYALFLLQADLCLEPQSDPAFLAKVMKQPWQLRERIEAGRQLRSNLVRLRSQPRGNRLQAHNLLVSALRQRFVSEQRAQMNADLNQAIALDPDLAQAYAFRAWVTFDFQDGFVKSLADLSQAIALEPEQAAWHDEHASILSFADRPEAALQAIETAIRLAPEQGKYYVRRADIHAELEDFEAALADLALAEGKNYQDADLYISRAKALEKLGRSEEARQVYLRAREGLLAGKWQDFDALLFSFQHPGVMEALDDPSGRIQDLDTLVGRYPQNPDVYYLRGEAHQQQGRPDAARKDFEFALSLAPEHKGSLNALAELELAESEPDGDSDTGAHVERDPAKSLSLYEKLVAKEPESTYYLDGLIQAHRALGHTAIAESMKERSIELRLREMLAYPALDAFFLLNEYWFEKEGELLRWRKGLVASSRKWPEQYLPMKYLARAHDKLGDRESALRAIEQALALRPDDPELLKDQGLILNGLHPERAVGYYTLLIEGGQAYANNYARRGLLNEQIGQLEAADADLKQAIKLSLEDYHPEQGQSEDLAYLAVIFRQTGRRYIWQDLLDQLVIAHPETAEIFWYRGKSALDRGEYAAALADFDKVLALEPGYPEVKRERAYSLLQLGRLDEALAGIDAVLKRTPDDADFLWLRGNILAQAGRHQEALIAYDRALAQPEPPINLALDRAVSLSALGALQEARSAFDDILEKEPEWAEAYAGRGEVYQQLGRCDPAQQDFATACELGLTEACEQSCTKKSD